MLDFLVLAHECAPTVSPQTLSALVSVESSHNPYAIGVVDGRLDKQPTDKYEAQLVVRELEAANKNFSVGIAQINRYNLPKYGLSYNDAFDACKNLNVGAKILEDCYTRAVPKYATDQSALRAALSCYYSGNFTRGFQPDAPGKPSYVESVVAKADKPVPLQIVPPIKVTTEVPAQDSPVLLGIPDKIAEQSTVVEEPKDETTKEETSEPATNTIVF